MMSEAIVGLGVAANVLQVLDFGVKFIFTAWRIYREEEDAFEEFSALQKAAGQFQSIVSQLQNGCDESDFREITTGCQKFATRILECLQSIHIGKDDGRPARDGQHRKREPGKISRKLRDALHKAFQLWWQKDEIFALQTTLDKFRDLLVVQLLVSIRKYASSSTQQQSHVLSKIEKLSAVAVRTEAMGKSILAYVSEMAATSENSHYIPGLRNELLQRIYADSKSQTSAAKLSVSPERQQRLEKSILALLRYNGMEDREGRIAPVYESTFRWIYGDPRSEKHSWSNFRSWLESPDQLYWITGKPGSGKSTLMKYICKGQALVEDEKAVTDCLRYLARWAEGNSRLLVAQYYFWNSGVGMQMTQEGLLRSLLHQLFSQNPSLVLLACPKRWEALCLFEEDAKAFDEEELRDMLMHLVSDMPSDMKLCLFVDGLDEFDGTHSKLLQLFQRLLDNRNVKLCVASRPWVVFEDGFQHKPSLRLEHLTHDDMVHYVTSRFNKDPNFEVLRASESEFADRLIDNVVNKSAGVFLWVDLVVSSLLAGMSYGDRVSDLQRRLDLLPPDLEALYEKILLSLDKFYLEHAVQYLALVKKSPAPMSMLFMSFVDENLPQFALDREVRPLGDAELERRVETMRRRINSRCKGLLEVGPPIPDGDGFGTGTVQYLHRTVKDYLESPDAERVLGPALSKSFDTAARFCAAALAFLKGLPDMHLKTDLVPRYTEICLAEAKNALSENKAAVYCILDELDRTGSILAKRVPEQSLFPGIDGNLKAADTLLTAGTWILCCPPTFEPSQLYSLFKTNAQPFGYTFLSLTVRYQLVDYAVSRVSRGCLVQKPYLNAPSGKLSHMVWSLLLDALWKPKDLNASRAQEIIQLLQHGADPNFYGNHVTSPWAIVLEYVFQFNRTEYLRANFKDVEFPGAGPAAELVTNMVKHGAAISTIPESDLDHIVEEVWGDFSIKFVRDRVKKAVENFEFRNRPGRNLVTLWW